ncbi:hypothetical protein OS493_007067 [Desmophyllum pertusum]|uniref:Apple domain-containing protein n=1 Tax=Desmophyllum pertusum TaxID=174260 RepID=A0A9X0D0V4_9CNID|nr:hypothetical protein OS493_007067 [Desmophyllum pertusum]
MWGIAQLSVLLIAYHTLKIVHATVEYNNEERSQRGMALLNHTYKSLYTENYPSCLMACMHDSQCTSLNYWWYSSQCDLNNRTKYSAEAKVFSRDISSTYMGLMREPGGWTAIQIISFTESNLHFENSPSRISDYKSLSNYSDHRMYVLSTLLLRLRNDMGFKQIRFYCHKKQVGTVLHIMTNLNPLGEAVVMHFIDDNLASTRPQTCGSYTVLPDDNSTLSKDCSMLGWNGTHADGKWTSTNVTGQSRIQFPLNPYGFQDSRRSFVSSYKRRDCDDRRATEASLSPGDTWAIFVR